MGASFYNTTVNLKKLPTISRSYKPTTSLKIFKLSFPTAVASLQFTAIHPSAERSLRTKISSRPRSPLTSTPWTIWHPSRMNKSPCSGVGLGTLLTSPRSWHRGAFQSEKQSKDTFSVSFFFCPSRILRCLAHDLGANPETFLRDHSGFFSDRNATSLRLLHYPPLGEGETSTIASEHQDQSKKLLTRCGVHSDYGGITLLFQVQMVSQMN